MITLFYPPATLPTSPYSSLPYLKGGLERMGYMVNCIDLNVEAYDFWLSTKFNAKACSLFQIENATKFLRSSESDIIDIVKYKFHRDNILSYFTHINNGNTNKNLSFGGYVYPDFHFSFPDLVALSKDYTDPLNAFYNYYLESIISIDNFIGISVTYDFQLLPALLLTYQIKRRFSDKKILLGGASIHYLKSFFLQNKWIFEIVDLIALGDGISTISNFINNTDNYHSSIYRNKNGEVKYSNDIAGIDSNDNVILNYSGLQLNKYFSPTLTGIVLTSIGCYYGKCAFCVPSKGKNYKYRRLPLNNIINNINQIRNELNSDIIFFGDDCLDINYHIELLNAIQDKLFWQAELRFERKLTESILRFYKDKGCLQILFGLESISQRVLDLMKKGTKLEIIRQILDDCYKTSIRTNMQTIVGFPTETVEEAYFTTRFIFDNKEKINSCAVSPFCLYQGSDVYLHPDKYKIEIIQDDHVCKYSSSDSLSESTKEKLSGVFFDSISEYLPYNTFFLDGPMGNHASIYYKHNIRI